MKKLLLFLLFTITSNAQFQTAYSPISQCDDNNDQFAVFDLTQLTPTILAPVSPNDYTVTYFQSFVNAQTNTNPIITPNSYSNIQSAVQTLGIRIVNDISSEVSFATVDIRVLPRPTPNPATLQFCDPAELPIYSLGNAIPQIIGNNANLTVTFHETWTDAQTGANPLMQSGYVPLVNPGAQTLFARAVNVTSGCFAVTTLTLNTQNCNSCQSSAPINLVASNITDTSLTLGWEITPGMGNQASLISIVPYGTPPLENSAVAVTTIQNQFAITNLQSESCYSIYIKGFCGTGHSQWSAPLNICMSNCENNGSCAEAIVLNAFIDSNNNGVKDNGELDFNQGSFVYQINDSGNNLYGNYNNGTYYIFSSNPSDSYDISFAINSALTSYFSSNTSFSNVSIDSGSGATYLNFPITVVQNYVDAACYLITQNQPRPGFTYTTTVRYRNNGYQTIPNGTLTFTKDQNVTIVSVSQSGITNTSTGFTYDFSNLEPDENRSFSVTLQVPTIPTVNLNDILTNSATIQINNDIALANNSFSSTQIVVGSYDPNDKSEAHGGRIVYADFTSNDYLYYTIRFENTGTANAEFIRVEDLLSPDLDETTFEMLNASHSVNTRRESNQLTWYFYNIDLPPTVTHPNDSHGYVHFRIKPKAGYALGDIISNTASIFFDYNPPIVTNTFNTEFVENLGTPSFSSKDILMYPNPANQSVTIDLSQSTENLSEIVFFDVVGKRVKVVSSLGEKQKTVDVSDLSKGIYLIEIQTENQLKTIKKLMIQ